MLRTLFPRVPCVLAALLVLLQLAACRVVSQERETPPSVAATQPPLTAITVVTTAVSGAFGGSGRAWKQAISATRRSTST
jgi:hypothetical protein